MKKPFKVFSPFKLGAIIRAINSIWSPKAFFVNNEPGAWYDPSDFSTLFQDSAGTTPVTAVEQPVGLMLDKSKGLVLGPEEPTSGLSSGWDSADPRWGYTTTSVSWSGNSGSTNTNTNTLYLNNSAKSRFVELRFTISNYSGSGNCGIDSGVLSSLANDSAAAGLIDTRISANGTYVFRGFWRGGGAVNGRAIAILGRGTNSFTISSISVRELPGNHAFQATSANRPVLSARVNLATETEFRNGLSDAPTRGGSLTATTLSGYLGALAFGSGVDTYAYKSNIAQNGINQTFTCVVKMDDGGAPMFSHPGNNTGVNNDFVIVIGGNLAPVASYTVTALGGGFYRVTAPIVSPTVVANNTGVNKYSSNSNRTFKVTAYDLRVTNTGVNLPPYQRVNTSTDYDTAGFPLYLKCNGTNTAMQTNSIDFTGTDKMTVWAGVRKLSDATTAIITELSASFDLNLNSFALFGPSAAGANKFRWYVKSGTGAGLVDVTSTAWNAPVSSVVSAIDDISGDVATLRINGSQAATSSGDQGTGNFGNYPLYLFARAGTSLFFNGQFYGAIIRGAQSSAAEIANAEQYLNGKTKAY